MSKYEINQTATSGPIAWVPRGQPWYVYIRSFIAYLIMAFLMAVLVNYNLSLLYQLEPHYAKNFDAKITFCSELDRLFVTSKYAWYVWSEAEKTCVKVQAVDK